MKSHDLKQLPEAHFRCDECGMFFVTTGEHSFFQRMEIYQKAVEDIATLGHYCGSNAVCRAKEAIEEIGE